jgi:hypothetical protein
MNAQPVDHDLLARYVGGALDDSPDGADVAELVANDPAWADAHDRLVVALEAVSADLAAYAAVDEPMPDDVAARLDAALADAPPALTVVPGGRSDGDRAASPAGPRHQRRRRKIPGWLAPVAAAAGVVAFAGFWLNSAGGGFSADDSGGNAATSSDAGGNAEQAPAAAGPIPRREATGRDYDDQQVADGDRAMLSSTAPQASAAPGTGKEPSGTFSAPDAAAPAQLARLIDPTALALCLEAIANEHGAPIATTTAVDYARYEGKPALMVFFVDAAGERWAWVAGPGCGAGGPDTRYSTRVA